jgi:hypothetical protein
VLGAGEIVEFIPKNPVAVRGEHVEKDFGGSPVKDDRRALRKPGLSFHGCSGDCAGGIHCGIRLAQEGEMRLEYPNAPEPKQLKIDPEASRTVRFEGACTPPRISYGSMPVVFRFGTKPTGMRVTSFRDLISTTETSFVTAFAT